MKKMIMAMAILMTIGVNAFTYLPVKQNEVEAGAEKKSSEQVENVRLEIASENEEWATGYDKDGNSYVVNEEWVQVGDVIDAMVNEFGEISSVNHITQEKKYNTEQFVVVDKTDDGYLDAMPLSADTNAPYGYILDDKYEIGDVVEVTYSNDDISAERKVTGKELEKVEDIKERIMKSVYEGRLSDEYVKAEDGSYVPISFYANSCKKDEVLAEDMTCVNKTFYQ